MTITKRLLALLLTLAMCLALASCQAVAPAVNASPSPSVSPSAELEVDLTVELLDYAAGLTGEETAITVNGQAVPADMVLYWLAMNCTYYDTYYGLDVSAYGSYLLSDSVNMTAAYVLLEQKSKELGCLLTDSQQKALQEQMKEGGDEAYQQKKQLFGLSDDTMSFIFAMDYYYDNLLDTLTEEPTEDELNNYVYHARHILLSTVDQDADPVLQADGSYAYPSLDDETIAAQKALAEALLTQLQAADDLDTLFNRLMEEHSQDSRDEDGALSSPDGYTAVLGQMVAPFEEAALALDFGELSGIVESEFGYHIILRDPVEDLEEYAQQYRENELDAEVNQWMTDAEIETEELLEELDVADFYAKYTAYRNALSASFQETEEE